MIADMDDYLEPTDADDATFDSPDARELGLRDPGSPTWAKVSWIAILSVIGLILFLNNVAPAPDPDAAATAEPSPTAGVMKLFARYAVGAVELAEQSSSDPAQADLLTEPLFKQLTDVAVTRDDHLRVALIAVDFGMTARAMDQLEQALEELDEDDPLDEAEADAEASDPTTTIPEYVTQDAAIIRTVIESGGEALSPDERKTLIEHHGWFAEIALTHGMDSSDSARLAAVGPARRMVYALLTFAVLAGTAMVAGMVIFVILLIKLSRRRLTLRYAPPTPGGSVFLETFALFMGGFIAVQVVAEAIFMALGVDATSWLIWLLPLVLLWPMMRGAGRAQAKFALGWHRGEGFIKEIGAGMVGYLAGLPIVGVGLLMTIALSALVSVFSNGQSGAPSHPIVEQADVSSLWQALPLYLLACVWAPITEESLFRGALYHHLRGRMRGVASGLLVGLIFGIIHPQGFLLVPPLMALGFVFAMIREWRGSIIASMTAHALHNGTLVTLLIIAMSA